MMRGIVLAVWMALMAALYMIGGLSPAPAQQWPYGGPPMWDRGQNREYQEDRRFRERTYDPYDQGPQRWQRQPRGISPEEYERRAYCSMHPRACP